MPRRITLELRTEIVNKAWEIAQRTHQRVEDVLAEWLDQYANELPVETLSDADVLALCHFEMNLLQKQALSSLLAHHRERALTDHESAQLDELLQLHRRGVLRKARAVEVATARGLLRKG